MSTHTKKTTNTTIIKQEKETYTMNMNKKLKKFSTTVITATMLAAALLTTGCGSKTDADIQIDADQLEAAKTSTEQPASEQTAEPTTQQEPVELTILAAASLTDVCNEIKTLYEEANPNVTLNFSYGSSGALQTQIEEGAPADVFFSAATKQMTALDEEGLMNSDSIVNLLENKIVLIVPADSDTDLSSFEEVATDKVTMIGLGEPESVPVGQYSEEVFTSLNILDAVKAKANYGSDVRTVLSWVETSAVDCGIVYATDAYTSENVKIVAEAPEGSCKQVIYPAGVVKASENADAAEAFVEYLQTEDTLTLFESYGFSRVE
jgi:molybdate transport system substrate-binding protein